MYRSCIQLKNYITVIGTGPQRSYIAHIHTSPPAAATIPAPHHRAATLLLLFFSSRTFSDTKPPTVCVAANVEESGGPESAPEKRRNWSRFPRRRCPKRHQTHRRCHCPPKQKKPKMERHRWKWLC